jgi:hypothetical protein
MKTKTPLAESGTRLYVYNKVVGGFFLGFFSVPLFLIKI